MKWKLFNTDKLQDAIAGEVRARIDDYVASKDYYPYDGDPNVVREEIFDWQESMSITGIFAAVREISQTLSSLPLMVFNPDDEEVPDHPLLEMLKVGNSLSDGQMIRQVQIAHLVLTGNSFSEIQRVNGEFMDNPEGTVLPLPRLYPISLGRVTVKSNDDPINPIKIYTYNRPGEQGTATLMDDQIFHISAFSLDGIQGRSIVASFGRVMNLMVQAEQYAGDFFRNAGTPRVALEMPDNTTPEALRSAKAVYEAANSGRKRQGAVVLPPGVKIQVLSSRPNEAQFNETKQTLLTDAARMTGVPARILGNNQGATYNNLVEDTKRYVHDALMPIGAVMETAWERYFLDEGYTIRHNYDELLQQESDVVISSAVNAYNSGLLTLNEARALINKGEVDGGDEFKSAPMESSEDTETEEIPEEIDEGETDDTGISN